MAQTGFTPIKLYASTTASAVPTSGNLDNTNGAELAINIQDEKLYFKNSAGTVKLLASNAASTGTVSSVAATVPAFLSVSGSPITTSGTLAIALSGTALPVANGGTGLTSPGTSGNVLTSNGTVFVSSPVPAGGLTYVSKTSNYTAADKEGILADTSGGAFTVTLPASPTTGTQVVIADAGAAFGTNNLTVGRNGSLIGGLAQNLVIDITGVSVQCVYDASGTATWEVYAQVGGNGGNAVTLTGTQTLTNKTIDAANLTGATLFAGQSGTSGQVLTSQGSGLAPAFAAPAASGTSFLYSPFSYNFI